MEPAQKEVGEVVASPKAAPPSFDKSVIRGATIIAGPLRLAQYKAFDYTVEEWSSWQYHMTYNNHVMAIMGESSAKLFAKFIMENSGATGTTNN
jgi:hypothetical protein